MSASRVIIILSIIAAFPAWAEHRRDVQESRALTNPVDAPADAEEEAVPPQLEQAVRSAERAIQSRSSQDLLGAIMMLLPYYYAENPPSAESSETDAILRELLAQRNAPAPETSPAKSAEREDEKAFFNAVGKKETAPAPIAEAPTAPRESTSGYTQGVDSPASSAGTIDNAREEVAVAPSDAPSDASAPIAAPANKRKARAKSKSVATRLMASLLDSLKQSKMADAAAKEATPIGNKTVAAPKLASAEIPTLSLSVPKSETPVAVQHAATGDKLHWLGWAVLFFLLALRQLHWMATRGRNKHHG